LQALQISAWNRARLVQPLAYFGIVLGLALCSKLSLTSATAALCCSLLLQFLYSRIRASRVVVGPRVGSTRFLGPLYQYGVRVWLSIIPQQINVRLDQLLLSIMPSVAASQLGAYAVAASLSWLALPVATAFGSVAFPAVARARTESEIRRIERTSILGSAGTAATVMVLLCAVAPSAIPRLFGPDFAASVSCVFLLAPGAVFLAVNLVLANLLQGRGKPLTTSIGEGTAVVLTVVLLALLVPPFGIRGAAVASSIAYLGSTVVLYSRLRVIRQRAASSAADGGAR
jgi:O-antigen/teichoic acid export membrane protein